MAVRTGETYLALVEYDPAADAFGLVIPDFPGCNAMGATFDEVEAKGIEALREWVVDTIDASGELPAARTIAELRQDPTLLDDFTPTTFVVEMEIFR